MFRTLVFLCSLTIVLHQPGCTRVSVQKVCGPHTKGIRYYRPKPYLFITADQKAPKEEATFTVHQRAPVKIEQASFSPDDKAKAAEAIVSTEDKPIPLSIKLEYLPDFAEEYAIDYKPGLGIGELNINLQNGWNLTSIGIKTDQQTDEIIGSIGSAIGAIASGSTKRIDAQGKVETTPCVYGSNVPLGFYEAVIACDPHGRKQLYGWRYVGFMPFQACPVQIGGMETACCNSADIYGLVYENNSLVFKPIFTIPHNN